MPLRLLVVMPLEPLRLFSGPKIKRPEGKLPVGAQTRALQLELGKKFLLPSAGSSSS